MTTRIRWIALGIGIVLTLGVIGTIWYARSRNREEPSALSPIRATPSRAPSEALRQRREEYTPEETRERERLTELIQRMPTSVSDTWPPGFRESLPEPPK